MKFTQVQLAALVATLASAQTLNIPTRVGDIVSLPEASVITGSVDLGNKEFDRGQPCDSDEDTGSNNAVFILEDGASLSNVIIGANALEGVHCLGSCTVTNVWFRDVCEDAISVLGTGDALIVGGGAQEAIDKVVQHNGAGTVTIKDYTVVNAGKLYRSCGDCTNNESKSPRKVIVENVRVFGIKSDVIGINSNFGDEATISGSCGVTKNVCQEYKGVNKGNGSSSKVDTKTSCKGTQGLLDALPACDAAPETPSESAAVPTPTATITASEVEPTPTASVSATEVEPTPTASVSATEVEPAPTASVSATEVEPTYTATVSASEIEQPTYTATVSASEIEQPTSSALSTLITLTKTAEATPTKGSSSGSVPRWGQCGGIGYKGATACATGECKVQNDWYSQCL